MGYNLRLAWAASAISLLALTPAARAGAAAEFPPPMCAPGTATVICQLMIERNSVSDELALSETRRVDESKSAQASAAALADYWRHYVIGAAAKADYWGRLWDWLAEHFHHRRGR
ncbi:MAG TPA: hypothetical protein VMS01_04175 [Stellaceae bacterium]|nr:hypothetical protein [Stellaceae bacterium]